MVEYVPFTISLFQQQKGISSLTLFVLGSIFLDLRIPEFITDDLVCIRTINGIASIPKKINHENAS